MADTHPGIEEEPSNDGQKYFSCSQLFTALVVSLGSMMVGFTMTWTSPALPSMAKNESTLHVTETEGRWIGSFMPLAGLLGGLSGGPLIEFLGRRTTISLTAIPMSASFLIIALAGTVVLIFISRFMAGFAVGVITLALPVYLGETIHPEIRGTLGLFPTLFGNGGILVCNIVGWLLEWRQLSIFGAAALVPIFIMSFLLPETPQWYMNKNKRTKARESLQWLRPSDYDIEAEQAQLDENHRRREQEETVGITGLCGRRYGYSVFVILGLMFFQQASGINAFMFYTVDFFTLAGTSINSNIASIIVTGVNVLATLAATLLIDRAGRKILLYISGIVLFLALVIVGVYFLTKPEGYGWLPLACLLAYVVGFSSGFGPIPWLMMGEILPAAVRGTAASVATGFNWFLTFVITNLFKELIDAIGLANVMFLFAGFVFVSLFFVYFFVLETKGKSLEDIERYMTSGNKSTPIREARRRSSVGYLKPTPS